MSMGEPTIHKTCVRVNSADEESRDEVDHDLPKKNPFIRGSDPRVATCRGRLQTRRCQLNQEINKELRLRAGAENLFKATTNRKLRETVALELSFVNSNLQLLKEQLAELNSSVELYQNDSKECVMPMIPLGLKETKEVDFREPFKDFILEHYSEDAALYEDPISDFMDMRQAIRTPVRSTAGVALLFKYYNQLYYIERRFFPPDRSLGVYFEWFDSLTGVPSCQRTVAFEKACVLFNIAGIYTQIGARQERNTCAGLDGAVDALLRAAGTLRYIHENFTNAPSVDLAAHTLLVLGTLMTAQARECLFEKLQLQAREACRGRDRELRDDTDMCLDLAQESAQLAHTYNQLYEKMQTEGVFNYVPYSWVSLVHVKTEFYRALAHQYAATGLLHTTSVIHARERLAAMYGPPDCNHNGSISPTFKYDEDLDHMALGRAHLAEALALYEEALRLQRMCRELRGKEALSLVVGAHRERASRDKAQLADEPDFADLLDVPNILPSSKFQLALTPPDFAQHRVEDLFKTLGPIAVFSAKRHWSAPRLVQLQRDGERRRERRSDRPKRKPSDKRDRSEDNSTYYEKYDYEVTKQNGVYINYESPKEYKRDLRRAASEYDMNEEEGFGFTVRGGAPVVIAAVEPNSLADMAGMREGDFIISIGDTDVKWSSHEAVVALIQRAGRTLTLRLATPMDSGSNKSSPETSRQSSTPGSVSAASTSSGSTGATARSSARRMPSWNPFRRHSARDHAPAQTNVIFR
ncbi:rhophilin-2 isoform X1 [Pieris napi]|uniref:rhophilin-2 isoform X1 n=1 Tax=Pieris napi TaxID=78633 RepID=UPI001FBB05D2|nr:rhophilin-2 isoform X1 [Pieris napi]